MMTNLQRKSTTPLVIQSGRSRYVRLFTLAGFLLVMVALAMLELSLPMFGAGVLLLSVFLVYIWRHHYALNGHPVVVRLDSDGRWYWQQGLQKSESVELLGDSYNFSFLVILIFRVVAQRRRIKTLLLTTDNIDPDTFRRLRLHLKWQERANMQSRLGNL